MGGLAYRLNNFINTVQSRKLLFLPSNQESHFFNSRNQVLFKSRITYERTVCDRISRVRQYLNAVLLSLDSIRTLRWISKYCAIRLLYGFGLSASIAFNLFPKILERSDKVVIDIFETELFYTLLENLSLPQGLLKTVDRLSYRRFFDSPNLSFFCLTRAMKRCLTRDLGFPADKVIVMYDTIDPNIYRAPQTFEDKMRHPKIIFMGDIYARDGVDVAVQALAVVKKKIPDIRLVITGKGPALPDVLRLGKRLGVSRNLEFTGWMEFGDLMHLLEGVLIGLVPFTDNLANRIVIPRKAFEYMAAGVPVVASNLEAMRELIDDRNNGLLVSPDAPDELAQRILDLMETRQFYDSIQLNATKRIYQHNYDVQQRVQEYFGSPSG